MKRKVNEGMDVHKETNQITNLTSNSKEILKEHQIKHNEVQTKKFIKKLKT
ncbi:IS110 family transposase, partial [Leptospira borgpetersenii serovar Hardjo-bovis]|nr:IS110 family transposase [Leptospira borgpetersenii serovar Hardjo-bovis]